MSAAQIALILSLANTTISLDTNNNYSVLSQLGVTTTVNPGDVLDAVTALSVQINQTQSTLQSGPNAAVLAGLMSLIASL